FQRQSNAELRTPHGGVQVRWAWLGRLPDRQLTHVHVDRLNVGKVDAVLMKELLRQIDWPMRVTAGGMRLESDFHNGELLAKAVRAHERYRAGRVSARLKLACAARCCESDSRFTTGNQRGEAVRPALAAGFCQRQQGGDYH